MSKPVTPLRPADLAAHRDVVISMSDFVADQLRWLLPMHTAWQPSDFLPNLVGDQWQDDVERLRAAARGLSDEVLVVLVGDTITEEALPSYQTMTNRHAGVTDETGDSDGPWAQWTRGWTAEENRHGDLLSRYLYLSGRVDMHAVERTTQHLIRNGFNPQTGNDPYHGLIYTSFQERATRVSHGRVAQLANRCGDVLLGKVCNTIAGDEARHEEVYKRFVGKIFELDPAGALRACAEMMRTTVTMPARLMDDGAEPAEPPLFERFAAVAQRIGAYTVRDYAEILEHLVDFWKIGTLANVSGDAAACQDYLCGLGARYRALADRAEQRTADRLRATFSWIFGRHA